MTTMTTPKYRTLTTKPSSAHYMTAGEAGRELGLSTATVIGRIKSGKIPGVAHEVVSRNGWDSRNHWYVKRSFVTANQTTPEPVIAEISASVTKVQPTTDGRTLAALETDETAISEDALISLQNYSSGLTDGYEAAAADYSRSSALAIMLVSLVTFVIGLGVGYLVH